MIQYKQIDDLTLMDDVLMTKVFDEDTAIVGKTLSIILNRTDLTILQTKSQVTFENIPYHSVKFDVLAKNRKGDIFNIEIQKASEGMPDERAVYYASLLTARSLKEGENYRRANNVTVIIISDHISHTKESAIREYRFRSEDGETLKSGTSIIYVNGKCRDGDLGKLMEDFHEKDVSKMHFKEISEKISFLKGTKEGRTDMSEYIRTYYAKEIAAAEEKMRKKVTEEVTREARKDKIKDQAHSVLSLMHKMNLDFGSAVELMDMHQDLDEIRKAVLAESDAD